MSKLTKERFPSSFGAFGPTGHLVLAFASNGDALKAGRALLGGGFKKEDVTHYNKVEVMSDFKKSETQSAGTAQMEQDVAKADEFLTLAKQGCGFLVVHAPKREQSKLAISIVQPFGLKFAEKYNRLAVEELA